jgi:hypothetical protein
MRYMLKSILVAFVAIAAADCAASVRFQAPYIGGSDYVSLLNNADTSVEVMRPCDKRPVMLAPGGRSTVYPCFWDKQGTIIIVRAVVRRGDGTFSYGPSTQRSFYLGNTGYPQMWTVEKYDLVR